MFEFAKFNSLLQKTLADIGKKNGLAAPESQDPLDKMLHEHYVAKLGEKVFKDRASKAKDALVSAGSKPLFDTVNDMLTATAKNLAGESAVVLSGQHYSLDFTTRKPASKLNVDKLKSQLMLKYKLTAPDIEQLFASCTEYQKPSEIWQVKPVR